MGSSRFLLSLFLFLEPFDMLCKLFFGHALEPLEVFRSRKPIVSNILVAFAHTDTLHDLLSCQIGQQFLQPLGPVSAYAAEFAIAVFRHLHKAVVIVVELCFVTVW